LETYRPVRLCEAGVEEAYMKVDDKIMHERRLERLNRLNFFIKEHPYLRAVALSEAHNLLAGFFQNSAWRVAAHCLKKALRDSWFDLKYDAWIFWNRKILRLDDCAISRKIDIQSGARIETCLKCGWSGLETEVALKETDEWTDAFCPKCGEQMFAELFVSDDELAKDSAVSHEEKQ
jgi:RNase P subunit RPR2